MISKFIKNTKGSFTIESSLIFPIIFITTLIVIFASLFFYQKASLYHIAGITAERAAYSWDNSHKNPLTGAYNLGMDDGIYWRMQHDSVSDLFGLMIPNDPKVLNLPVVLDEDADEDYSGVLYKLWITAKQLKAGTTGTITYANHLFDRKIEVSLESWLSLPSFVEAFLSKPMHVKASSRIVEPVEYIRIIDTVRTYAAQLKDQGLSKGQAKQALDEFLGKKAPVSFKYHREAHAYLLTLVDGRERKFETSYGLRKVDALDSKRISHQAYVTFNENQIRSQMNKDAELLLEGEHIKGVIWHFFRRTNQAGKVGPSNKLRAELEANGIVVMVHD